MEVLKSILSTVAPGLATFLGGPLAGMITAFLGKTFLGDDTASVTDIAVAMKDPANLVKLKEIESQFALAQLASSDRYEERQTAIDLEEAKSNSFFQAGARPLALWISVIGFGYNFLIVPICHSFGVPAVGIPTDELSWLLGGLLGLGSMRSVDKYTRRSKK